jgi:uncharacterized membrane protein
MSRSTLLAIILVLAFLGLIDSVYLAHAALSDTALSCGISGLDGCNIVAQSAYSRIFGVPNGIYGVVFYALTLILSFVMIRSYHSWMLKLLLALTSAGLIASFYFLYLQVFLIKALCIYCLGSFIAALLICGASWLLRCRECRFVLPTPPVLP